MRPTTSTAALPQFDGNLMVLLSFAYGRGRENLSPSPQHLNEDFRFAMASNDCTSNTSFRELFSILSIPSNSGGPGRAQFGILGDDRDRKSKLLHSSHLVISYAVFCL